MRKIYLTQIDADVAGDTLMPPFDLAQWRERSAQTFSGAPFESGTWYGLLAPAGTPRVSRINGAVVRILKLSEVREELNTQGTEPLSGTPSQVGAYVRSEIPVAVTMTFAPLR